MNKLAMKIFILVFLMLSVFVSCNQNLMGIGAATKNFITAPYRGIRDAIANRSYNRVARRTERAHEENGGDVNITCVRTIEDILEPEVEGDVEGLRDAVRETVCTCKAWGSCDKSVCSCENLCPETLELLQRTDSIQDLSKKENSLSFRNEQVAGADHEMTNGFCWGHASLTSKFNRLAFFEPEQEPPFSLTSNNEEEQNQALDFYKEQIDKIVNNEVAEFPGIPNLETLSSIPGLESYLFDKMGSLWADNAMTFQGLFTSLKSEPKSPAANREFFEDVKRKIDNHEQPQIVFTGRGYKFYTHAVLVSHYIVEDGKTILCIRDNNSDPEINHGCENKMYINEQGVVEYDNWMWGELGDIKIAHNDNREALSQMNALHDKCQADKGCDQ